MLFFLLLLILDYFSTRRFLGTKKEKAKFDVSETEKQLFYGNNARKKDIHFLRNSGIIKHKTRQLFLVELIESLIKSRSVVFSELADKIDKQIKSSSIERRIQDFFQKVKGSLKIIVELSFCQNISF